MANIELLKKVAEAIENEETHFNMATYFDYGYAVDYSPPRNVCGTASCIAGHTIAVAYPDAVSRSSSMFYSDSSSEQEYSAYGSAMDLLELTADQAHWLFMGEFRDSFMEHITRNQALTAIRLLIEKPDLNPYNDEDIEYLVLFDSNGVEIENALEEFLNG